MRIPSQRTRPRRPAKVLTLFALLLPVFMGMLGLVNDLGIAYGVDRHVHNAADGAAQAAARVLFREWGDNLAQAKVDAEVAAKNYVQNYNGLTHATFDVKFYDEFKLEPYKSLYASSTNKRNFVQVTVTHTIDTWFIRVLGINSTTCSARAVAGFEPIGVPEGADPTKSDPLNKYKEGIVTLDPNPQAVTGSPTGLTVKGGTTLRVYGTVVVNSKASGSDQYGHMVNWAGGLNAIFTGKTNTLLARYVQVRGGVDNVATIDQLDAMGPKPLYCQGPVTPDSLADKQNPLYRPTPTLSNGVVKKYWSLPWNPNTKTFATASSPQKISIKSNQNPTFSPGIYGSIEITGDNGTVTFNPGIYVIMGGNQATGFALYISTQNSAKIIANQVLFYNTGDNYTPSDGEPDASDGNNPLPAPNGPQFGKIQVQASNLQLTYLKGGPFDGMVIYQRRRNAMPIKLLSNAGQPITLTGQVYAKWAPLTLTSAGIYTAQFIVGSMTVGQAGGPPTITIDPGADSHLPHLKLACQVFQVE